MVRRRLTYFVASAAIGFAIAMHEQPRERAIAAAHLAPAPITVAAHTRV